MTSKQYLNSLRYFQYVFTIGLLSSAGMLGYFLNSMEAIPLIDDESLYTILNIVCIAFGLSILGTSLFFFNISLARIDIDEHLTIKLEKFKHTYIIRSAMIEGAGIIAAVIFFLTASNLSIYVFIACLIILFILSPKKKEIKKSLRLNLEESLKIDQDHSVISKPNELIFKHRLN